MFEWVWFGGGTIAKPGCQRHARDALGRSTAHVEYDRANAATP